MTDRLDGKIVLVTGATEGIGKAAAREFLARGAHVVVVGRDRAKTDRVVAELGTTSGNERIESIVADLSTIAGGLEVARAFESKHDRLDVLVNNAGAIFHTRRLSADGIEMTFALNHMAYFTVTTRLLGLLTRTPGARVVSTASAAHSMGKLDFSDVLTSERGYNMFKAYSNAKLANVLFTRELARRERGRLVANCYHPGLVRTRFGVGVPGFLNGLIQAISPIFGRTPEKGAETMLWLATSPEAAEHSGEYFQDRKLASTKAPARDDRMAAELWDVCEAAVARASQSARATHTEAAT